MQSRFLVVVPSCDPAVSTCSMSKPVPCFVWDDCVLEIVSLLPVQTKLSLSLLCLSLSFFFFFSLSLSLSLFVCSPMLACVLFLQLVQEDDALFLLCPLFNQLAWLVSEKHHLLLLHQTQAVPTQPTSWSHDGLVGEKPKNTTTKPTTHSQKHERW